MKALTICNPYPYLILADRDKLPPGTVRKRVENRNWNMAYRGPLLIHAGQSRAWMGGHWDEATYPLVWGAIVGMVEVVDCVAYTDVVFVPAVKNRYPWLALHQHACGPHCIVMENPVRFLEPIPYRGRQGLFDVPREVVAEYL